MRFQKQLKPVIFACAALVAACASQPPAPSEPAISAAAATPAAPATDAARKNEAEAADALEKKFQEAARGYKVVQKDGKTLYCKREKVIGTTIPTMQCMSEAALRQQVEQMEDLRQRMRNNGRCPLGPGGCSGGS